MVVTDPEATLLTACQNGYGKRTPFGANQVEEGADTTEDDTSSSARYRTQKRGGKGLRDIKATDRNGPVVGIIRVDDDDEVLMMTSGGKIQRIRASDVGVIGRNTQGVRIMTIDGEDTLAAVVRVPQEEGDEEVIGEDASESPAAEATVDATDAKAGDTAETEANDDDDEGSEGE